MIITVPEDVNDPYLQTYLWSDSLFSLAWSEKNENLVVCGSGDGSIQIYDISNAKVFRFIHILISNYSRTSKN